MKNNKPVIYFASASKVYIRSDEGTLIQNLMLLCDKLQQKIEVLEVKLDWLVKQMEKNSHGTQNQANGNCLQ